MARPVIAVDIDEVLAPFNARIIDYYNRMDATTIAVDQYGPVDFDVLWGVSYAEAIARFEAYHRDGHSGRHEPHEASMEALQRLQRRYDLTVITSRQSEFQQLTVDWIERHYPDIFMTVRFANYWDAHLPRSSKADICRQMGAIALIDDDIKYISEATESGLEGVLFGDYSWNQAARLPHGAIRVANWEGVVQHFMTRV